MPNSFGMYSGSFRLFPTACPVLLDCLLRLGNCMRVKSAVSWRSKWDTVSQSRVARALRVCCRAHFGSRAFIRLASGGKAQKTYLLINFHVTGSVCLLELYSPK